MVKWCLIVIGLAICSPLARSTDAADPTWAYIDNGQVKLGVKKTSGAAIAYFSESDSQRNLLNHYDHGRLVQQSYYGKVDGSIWGKKPWRWNPVQGGDYKGGAAKVLELKVEKTSLYAKSMGRNWAGCTDLPEVIFEEWITLTGKVAHVHYQMTYSGQDTHPRASQEIPAVFVQPDLETLVLYNGQKPWTGDVVQRSKPGWPNESRQMTEHWAAYVDKDDYGIGAYIPIADKLTCYRFGKTSTSKGACSYFAPVTEFAIKPGFVFKYDLYLTLGKSTEIRGTFKRIYETGARTK